MKKYIFGVDVGGTSIKTGLLTTDGTLLEHWEIKTDTTQQGEHILPDICRTIEEKCSQRGISKEEVLGIGLAVPGPVCEDGTIYHAANLGWGIFNVEKTLADLSHLPVKAGNDANVAALGEIWKGGAEGFSDVVMFTLGTGVGGGIVLGGKILSGANGAAGEVGHIPVQEPENEPETCGCGKRGCLEQYASAPGLLRLTRRYLAAHPAESSVLRENANLTAKDVLDAAKAGDSAALAITNQLYRYLGKALAIAGVVLDPQCFLIGGGMSGAGEILLQGVRNYYKLYAFPAVPNAQVRLASLGNKAGMYGAARMLLG